MHTQRQIWLGWLPVLIWMTLIFSASTDALSAAHTSRFIEPFLRWLFQGRLSETGIDEAHFLIRKLAHVSEYAVLAVLTWNALRLSFPAGGPAEAPRLPWLAGLISVVYAAGDEFHQSFVPSRQSSVRDVLIDAAGAAAGLLLLRGCQQIRRRRAETPRPDKS